MKYKVGDKVRIKSIDWYNKNKDENNWVSMKYSTKVFNLGMSRLCGMTATILSIQKEFGSYKIDIDNGLYFWTCEMFDETYNENKMKNKKVKITLPKNCEVDNVKASIEDGYLVVEYTPKEKFSPKDGDILSCGERIVIYKWSDFDGAMAVYYYLASNGMGGIPIGSGYGCGYTHTYHLASESEKEKLFSYMKENGYTFNQETKRVEKIRWRAERENSYYFINSIGNGIGEEEGNCCIDTERFKIGNYFKTEEEAQEYANKFKELLKDRL